MPDPIDVAEDIAEIREMVEAATRKARSDPVARAAVLGALCDMAGVAASAMSGDDYGTLERILIRSSEQMTDIAMRHHMRRRIGASGNTSGGAEA